MKEPQFVATNTFLQTPNSPRDEGIVLPIRVDACGHIVRITDAPSGVQQQLPSLARKPTGCGNLHGDAREARKRHELGELDVFLSVRDTVEFHRLVRSPPHYRGECTGACRWIERDGVDHDRPEVPSTSFLRWATAIAVSRCCGRRCSSSRRSEAARPPGCCSPSSSVASRARHR